MQTDIVRIGIVDDHSFYRRGLSDSFASTPSFQTAFHAGNGEELQAVLKKVELPDILLLDIIMPVMDGFATIEWLHETHPALPVIILSMCETNLTMTNLIQLGARAILRKGSGESELPKAIQRVLEEGYYFNDPASRKLLLDMYKEEKKKRGPKSLLTVRELRFLKLATTNLTHVQIAAEMKISARAVNKVSSNLFEKLGVSSRVVLAMEAVRNGLIQAA